MIPYFLCVLLVVCMCWIASVVFINQTSLIAQSIIVDLILCFSAHLVYPLKSEPTNSEKLLSIPDCVWDKSRSVCLLCCNYSSS